MQRRAAAEVIRGKLRPPLAVVLGAPREVAELLAELEINEATCYQMDLYLAERLRAELAQRGLAAQVVASADLWDLPPDFQTALYPAPLGGERGLKIDTVEQAFHVLRPHGLSMVLSPYQKDQLFPGFVKKVFGAVHATAADRATIFWGHREEDRPRGSATRWALLPGDQAGGSNRTPRGRFLWPWRRGRAARLCHSVCHGSGNSRATGDPFVNKYLANLNTFLLIKPAQARKFKDQYSQGHAETVRTHVG